MKKLPLAFAALLVFVASSACAERLQVDIAALAASTNQYTSENNVATTNGWTLFAIDSYTGKPNIRLSAKEDYLISPTFNQRILSIELKVKSSSQSDRRLAFIPIYDGVPTEDATLWSLCNYSPNKDTYVAQTNFFPRAANVRSFKMAFDNGGGSTGWGVSEMTIVTDDTPVLTPPTNLSASNIKGTRSNLSWENPENAVSNRVEVSSVQLVDSTGTTVEEFGFDEISAGGNAVNFAGFRDSLPPHYEKLSGTYLYAAANSTGLLQISTGKDRGELVYSGYASYTDLTLMLTLKRYSGDANTMTIGWTDGGATTNILGTINLADDFTTEFIDLSSVTDGAILIFNNSGNDDNHRVIIDKIAFIRDYSPASVSTNLVKTVFATGNTATIRGLSPYSSYIASITAFDEDGNVSEPSEPISFMTNGAELPLVIKLQ